MPGATLQAAINVATVPDPDHQNHQPDIVDRVDDPKVSGAETIQVRLNYLHPGQRRINCQPVDALCDPLLVVAGKLCPTPSLVPTTCLASPPVLSLTSVAEKIRDD